MSGRGGMTVEECVYWLWVVQRHGRGTRSTFDEIDAIVSRDTAEIGRLIKSNLSKARFRYDDLCPPFWRFEATLVMLLRAAKRAIERERGR